MKVITLKQPWATLVAEGIKQYEFRSWPTKYRGEILIHAGSGVNKEYMARFKHLNLEYPKFKILAKVTITDCIMVNKEINKKINNENKLVYGDFDNRTGYAWKIEKPIKLNIDKEIKGQLGLWNIELD